MLQFSSINQIALEDALEDSELAKSAEYAKYFTAFLGKKAEQFQWYKVAVTESNILLSAKASYLTTTIQLNFMDDGKCSLLIHDGVSDSHTSHTCYLDMVSDRVNVQTTVNNIYMLLPTLNKT